MADVDLAKRPDEWIEEAQPLSSNCRTDKILRHIRNSLAHGNIYTIGDPIEHLILLQRDSEPNEGTFAARFDDDGGFIRKITLEKTEPAENGMPENKYSLLSVSACQFKSFLDKWFDFLKNLPVGNGDQSVDHMVRR